MRVVKRSTTRNERSRDGILRARVGPRVRIRVLRLVLRQRLTHTPGSPGVPKNPAGSSGLQPAAFCIEKRSGSSDIPAANCNSQESGDPEDRISRELRLGPSMYVLCARPFDGSSD